MNRMICKPRRQAYAQSVKQILKNTLWAADTQIDSEKSMEDEAYQPGVHVKPKNERVTYWNTYPKVH